MTRVVLLQCFSGKGRQVMLPPCHCQRCPHATAMSTEAPQRTLQHPSTNHNTCPVSHHSLRFTQPQARAFLQYPPPRQGGPGRPSPGAQRSTERYLGGAVQGCKGGHHDKTDAPLLHTTTKTSRTALGHRSSNHRPPRETWDKTCAFALGGTLYVAPEPRTTAPGRVWYTNGTRMIHVWYRWCQQQEAERSVGTYRHSEWRGKSAKAEVRQTSLRPTSHHERLLTASLSSSTAPRGDTEGLDG